MPSEGGASAFLPRKPRSVTVFAKSAVMVAPPEGGQRGLSRVILRDGIGIGILRALRCGLCQLLDETGADLPPTALDRGFLLALTDLGVELGAAKLAFNFDV